MSVAYLIVEKGTNIIRDYCTDEKQLLDKMNGVMFSIKSANYYYVPMIGYDSGYFAHYVGKKIEIELDIH